MANNDQFEYDVALSFAGEDREIAREFSDLLSNKNVKVFYDEDYADDLWGKDLIAHLADLYQNKARYCVIFISKYYPLKRWTNFEREHIEARAFRDTNEYILPIRLDDSSVPGIAETRGYRDIRQHPLASIADTLEKKLAKAKGQVAKSFIAQDQQSSNRESTHSPFGSIPMPKAKKTFTELDKARFGKEAFSYIKQYFQKALQEAESSDSNLQTEFDEITHFRFRATIYVHGNARAQYNIWLGDNLTANTIYFNEGTRGLDDNSINGYLPVVDNGEELRLHIQDFGFGSRVRIEDEMSTKQQAAEYLWRRLISHLEY